MAYANTTLALPLPWHKDVWEGFNRAIDTDRMPHALLLHGSNGVGKRRLAITLAQRLLCGAGLISMLVEAVNPANYYWPVRILI